MDKSRREFLKVLAGAPLLITFGFSCDAMVRFLKPTMKPLGIFDPSDQPTSAYENAFTMDFFPEVWNCIPFLYGMKISTFNPEKEVIRNIPGFILRLPSDEIVAYSRICPRGGCIVNYRLNYLENCGCAPDAASCCCRRETPVFICPCDNSMWDAANDARSIRGCGGRPLRRFQVERQGDKIAVVRLESGAIA